jgi:hypothetical protein
MDEDPPIDTLSYLAPLIAYLQLRRELLLLKQHRLPHAF